MARKMVTEYGMSEKIGPLSFNGKDDLVFLGRDIAEAKNYSEKTAQIIDEEVKKILSRGEAKAKELLGKYKNILKKIADQLIKEEIIDRDEFEKIILENIRITN